MFRVVQFNWPMYAAAIVSFISLIICSMQPTFSGLARMCLIALSALVLVQTTASLLASYWVYDLSQLKGWLWLKDVCAAPDRIVVVHAGYDETGGSIGRLFPQSEILFVDFFPDLKHYEPSIVRARNLYPPSNEPLCTTIDHWPIADSSAELVLIAFAAHELRASARRAILLSQARTIVKPEGQIVLVEHLRDLPNFVAFGPGAFHFFPPSAWLKSLTEAGLTIESRFKITPLVEVFLLCR